MANFQTERLVIGAMAMAEAREAIGLTFDYVTHAQGLRRAAVGQAGDPPAPGDAGDEVEAARQLVLSHGLARRAGHRLRAEVSMVKALCGDLVNEVLYDCVQFHGGMGFMRETAIERMARDARVQSIGGGASEVMLEEVAKRL